MVWIHSDDKDLCWETQFNFRNAVAGHMNVARETPTFIYRNSLDLTGFIDGTGNPAAGGSVRPRHRPRRPAGGRGLVLHRAALGARPQLLQRPVVGGPGEHLRSHQGRLHQASRCRCRRRTSATSSCTRARPPTTAPRSAARWCAVQRRTRSTTGPSACTSWASVASRHRCASGWKRSTGTTGTSGDALTDYSTPASGSFYFAPSVGDVGRQPSRSRTRFERRGHRPFGNCPGYRYEARPMNVHSALCAETLSLLDSTTIVALALGR